VETSGETHIIIKIKQVTMNVQKLEYLKKELSTYSKLTDEYLQKMLEELQGSGNKELKTFFDATRHYFKAGGKRIRPFLCINCFKAVGGKDHKKVLPIATALEVLHNASLVHDDIQDSALMRRGIEAVHTKFGISTGIWSGTYLLSLPLLLIIQKLDCENGRKVEILSEFAEGMAKIIEGQYLDMSFEQDLNTKEKDYLGMIDRKTGALLKLSCVSGAIAGDADKFLFKAIENYGKAIGSAFQIYDDVLDIVAEEANLGKMIGGDIKEGKLTLIVIHFLKTAKPNDRNKFLEIFLKEPKSKTRNEINTAITLLKKYGAIEYCRKMAIGYSNLAKKSIYKLPESEAKGLLIDVADYVVAREK